MWNALWYFFLIMIFSLFCVVIYLPCFPFVFPFKLVWKYFWFARSGVVEFCVIFLCVWNVLWYCGISCYIFPHVERALVLWNFVLYFPHVERSLVLWDFVLYFPVCGTSSGIVAFCVIFFRTWNALWYCWILCYIFLNMERALVLWGFVLYVSVYGMRSGIVEFCVIFFCMWDVLWYCGISCYIFPCVECALVLWNFVLYLFFQFFGGDNWTSPCTYVFFRVVFFIIVFFVSY